MHKKVIIAHALKAIVAMVTKWCFDDVPIVIANVSEMWWWALLMNEWMNHGEGVYDIWNDIYTSDLLIKKDETRKVDLALLSSLPGVGV